MCLDKEKNTESEEILRIFDTIQQKAGVALAGSLADKLSALALDIAATERRLERMELEMLGHMADQWAATQKAIEEFQNQAYEARGWR